MSRSEAELVALATQGQRTALAQLLERSAGDLRAALQGKIDPRWQSLLSDDDVLQETYADATLAIESFEYAGPGSFLAWLRQISHNNLIDAVRGLESHRRGGRRQRVESSDSRNSSVEASDWFSKPGTCGFDGDSML